MQMSVWKLTKVNSIARHVTNEMFRSAPWKWARRGVFASLEGCLNVWEEEIRRNSHQGIVVGSSWGGAVATLALVRGVWRGPTVLLAPAYGRVAEVAGWDDTELSASRTYEQLRVELTEEEKKRIVIVHGVNDEVVDIKHSREMSKACELQLIEVEGGDHQLFKYICGTDNKQELPLLRRLIDGFHISTQ